MNKVIRTSRTCKGFSLAEVLASVIIGAMILVTVLGVYNRALRSVEAVTKTIDSSRLPSEVLQRIAEDLDKIISTADDTNITIENTRQNNYPSATLTISRNYQQTLTREQMFDQITWTCSYDYQSNEDGLVLYRSYSGITLEDKVLDKDKSTWERELFIPVCEGVTFFKITALGDKEPLEKWDDAPPYGINITLSFAEPFKKVDGTLDVQDEEKISRTISIDRTRNIKFYLNQDQTTETEI
ncbi:type II secretion system protein J [Planctomycetota bacterium]